MLTITPPIANKYRHTIKKTCTDSLHVKKATYLKRNNQNINLDSKCRLYVVCPSKHQNSHKFVIGIGVSGIHRYNWNDLKDLVNRTS